MVSHGAIIPSLSTSSAASMVYCRSSAISLPVGVLFTTYETSLCVDCSTQVVTWIAGACQVHSRVLRAGSAHCCSDLASSHTAGSHRNLRNPYRELQPSLRGLQIWTRFHARIT